MKPEEWEKLLVAATEGVMRQVGTIGRSGERGRTVGTGASGDKTLEADRAAEEELVNAITKVKGTRVLSEEAGFCGDPDGKALAVVDPLDGSSNFARGIPFYCTSVAIVEGDALDDVAVGVVRDLVRGDVYHAVKGKGSRKNGTPVKTSEVTEVSRAVLGVDLSRGGPGLVASLAPLIGGAKRQVHFGANAQELCYVADRTFDGFVDVRGSLRITDLAAAYLVAREAGAEITDVRGEKLDVAFDLKHKVSFVASANRTLHDELLKLCGVQGLVGRKGPG